MRAILALMWLVALLSGCVTDEKVRGGIIEGMSKAQVIGTLGKPDGFKRAGEFEALQYTNRLISGWSWDRTDYTVILRNDRVVEYGPGEVRQAPQTARSSSIMRADRSGAS